MISEENIKIRYLTNCAVFIEYGTVKIIVDAIFSGKQPFNIMDRETEEEILNGTGEFENINYVLVTHCHNDHYNGSKLLKFLNNNPQAKLIVPSNARLDADRLEEVRATPIFLTGEAGKIQNLDFGSLHIEYMKTNHLTYRYPDHYIYNIILGDANVLLTADMDYVAMEWLGRFTKKKYSVVFLCHIFLWHRKWREQIEALNYTETFFYHLPDEERDRNSYRKKALMYWDKHSPDFTNADLLQYNLPILRGKYEIY